MIALTIFRIVVLVLILLAASFWAFLNLLGVPMLERSAMHAGQGWVALIIAALTLLAIVVEARRLRNTR